ncbi:MAG TPA: dienelactone hydrolase family protein [Sporichthyaceae bacterium]|nr:dienelactone hydrolase family protein [Sporichthyaceae bacterium]
MAMRDYLIGELTEEYAAGLLSRREALRRLALMGLGVGAATTLLAACGHTNDAAAPPGDTASPIPTPPPTPSSTPMPPQATPPPGADAGALVRWTAAGVDYRAAWKAAAAPRGAVLVIHENKGLTTHFYDLVGRFATHDYSALCVDLLSRSGPDGTAGFTDQAAATATLARTPTEQLLSDLHAGVDELQRRTPGQPVGVVGFCFGGGMTWNLLQVGPLQDQRVQVAVPFYGPAPATPDFTGARAAVLAIYGALDARVDATRAAATAAMEKAGLVHEVITYDNADHAFFNDTGPRYNATAATAAQQKMFQFMAEHLIVAAT